MIPVHEAPEDWAKDPALQDGLGRVPVLPRVPRSALPMHKVRRVLGSGCQLRAGCAGGTPFTYAVCACWSQPRPSLAPLPRGPVCQYLLSLDGHTAAYRFATLLGTNSLVLKQVSRQVEWFYASVRPWTHYAPILENRTDVLGVLAWAEAHPAEVGAMIAAANRFALTYTTYYSRVVYWVYALHVYKSLFADQAEFLASRGAMVRDLVAAYHRQHLGGGKDLRYGDSGGSSPGGASGGAHVRLSRRRHAGGDAATGRQARGREER